jgi:hypothetical protein
MGFLVVWVRARKKFSLVLENRQGSPTLGKLTWARLAGKVVGGSDKGGVRS